jgi:hypothetical protein
MGSIRRRRAVVVTAATAVLLCAALLAGGGALAASLPGGTGARTAASGGTWGKAEEVPGTAALSDGEFAEVSSVSCASAGNCGAGGSYEAFSGAQAFVVSEVKGKWGKAEEVPGTAALNTNRVAEIGSVSCASAGDCSAGGYYEDVSGYQAFVVGEVKGKWGKAQEVPGTAALNAGGWAETTSVSCASAGDCGAGGYYAVASRAPGAYSYQPFVVSEVKGKWGKAQEVPGMAALDGGSDAGISSVSCASAGNCSAAGSHPVGTNEFQAFVVSEVKGKWGKAQEVPGMAALNAEFAEINSVSCASAGNCGAGGSYYDVSGFHAFVVGEVKGKWGKAQEVPGAAAVNIYGDAINSVSCASAGDCEAGGNYELAGDHFEAFVVSEAKGKWGKPEEVPGTAALNTGGGAQVTSVSCASAGNCGAGGDYTDASGAQAFVVSEVNGRWGKAEEVPGTAALNTNGNAAIASVSCASAGNCGAGGHYQDGFGGGVQAFVVSEVK